MHALTCTRPPRHSTAHTPCRGPLGGHASQQVVRLQATAATGQGGQAQGAQQHAQVVHVLRAGMGWARLVILIILMAVPLVVVMEVPMAVLVGSSK